MKYLYYILAFIAASSIVCSFFLFRGSATPIEECALIVNDRKISRKDFEQPIAARMNKDETEGDYLESVITRELLIQEARRQGIGREETFRAAMQSFYEQSLVKVLMNRQYSDFSVDVTDVDLDQYTKWMNSKVSFTLFSYEKIEDIKKGTFANQEVRSGKIFKFSEFVRQQLYNLQPSEGTAPSRSGDMYLVFRLDTIEPGESTSEAHRATPDEFRAELAALKKEQLMSKWLNDLRDKADIVVFENSNLSE